LAAPVLGRAHSPSSSNCDYSLTGQKPFHLKNLLALEHEIHRASEFVRENGKRLSLAVLSLQTLASFFEFIVVPQHQQDRLSESPAEVGVADLCATHPAALAGGSMCTLHEASVGGEVLHSREALDVVNFIEESHSQDLPDAGNGPQPVEIVRIVHLDPDSGMIAHPFSLDSLLDRIRKD